MNTSYVWESPIYLYLFEHFICMYVNVFHTSLYAHFLLLYEVSMGRMTLRKIVNRQDTVAKRQVRKRSELDVCKMYTCNHVRDLGK